MMSGSRKRLGKEIREIVEGSGSNRGHRQEVHWMVINGLVYSKELNKPAMDVETKEVIGRGDPKTSTSQSIPTPSCRSAVEVVCTCCGCHRLD